MTYLKAYVCVSRNKDNKNVKDFKTRSISFLEYSYNEAKIIERFKKFVEEGVEGETSRLYCSVNDRDEEATKKDLICELLKNDKIPVNKLESFATSIARRKENKSKEDNYWLLDIDESEEVVNLIDGMIPKSTITFQTVNNFTLLVKGSFDTRFLNNYNYDVTLNRDGDLLLLWATKGSNNEYPEHLRWS